MTEPIDHGLNTAQRPGSRIGQPGRPPNGLGGNVRNRPTRHVRRIPTAVDGYRFLSTASADRTRERARERFTIDYARLSCHRGARSYRYAGTCPDPAERQYFQRVSSTAGRHADRYRPTTDSISGRAEVRAVPGPVVPIVRIGRSTRPKSGCSEVSVEDGISTVEQTGIATVTSPAMHLVAAFSDDDEPIGVWDGCRLPANLLLPEMLPWPISNPSECRFLSRKRSRSKSAGDSVKGSDAPSNRGAVRTRRFIPGWETPINMSNYF